MHLLCIIFFHILLFCLCLLFLLKVIVREWLELLIVCHPLCIMSSYHCQPRISVTHVMYNDWPFSRKLFTFFEGKQKVYSNRIICFVNEKFLNWFVLSQQRFWFSLVDNIFTFCCKLSLFKHGDRPTMATFLCIFGRPP